MSGKRGGGLQTKPTRLKLKDLAHLGEVQIKSWELPDPDRTYHANSVGVTRQGREATAIFAQVLPESSRVVNAVLVSLPGPAFKEALGGFEAIRERLARLQFTQPELDGVRVKSAQLDSLAPGGYLGLRADLVRGACGDDAAVLDFFSRPIITDALVEARPHEPLKFEGEIRISCSSLVLAAFLRSAEEVSANG